MASLRRTLLAIVATFVLLFGFGGITMALACSATAHVAEAKTDHGACCGGSNAPECVPASCLMVYQAVPPIIIDGTLPLKPISASYWSKVKPLFYQRGTGTAPATTGVSRLTSQFRYLEIIMKKFFAAAVVLVLSSSAAYAAAPEAVHAVAKACGLPCC